MNKCIVTLSVGISCFLFQLANAQTTDGKNPFPYSNKLSIQTGLLQDLILDGQNLVLSYNTKRWVFDWSHGISLDFKSGKHLSNNEAFNTQKLNVHTPWSTGPSIGYRVTPLFNIRAEFKAHKYEVTNSINNAPIADYTMFTIGVGAFYEWYPFKKNEGWLKGFLVEPVIRYWPNIGSSNKNNLLYNNAATGKVESLPDYKLGLLYNINIGYTIGL